MLGRCERIYVTWSHRRSCKNSAAPISMVEIIWSCEYMQMNEICRLRATLDDRYIYIYHYTSSWSHYWQGFAHFRWRRISIKFVLHKNTRIFLLYIQTSGQTVCLRNSFLDSPLMSCDSNLVTKGNWFDSAPNTHKNMQLLSFTRFRCLTVGRPQTNVPHLNPVALWFQ